MKRRETYPETVERLMNFFRDELGEDIVTPHFYKQGKQAILGMSVMPSMRAMWAAGKAAKQNNITMYNCSFLVIDNIQAFSEILFILMCGTGVGFSVERRFVDKLPRISFSTGKTVHTVVGDSKEDWAQALDRIIRALWAGHDVTWDVSSVRQRGARLETMGGRASGPEPLVELFQFLVTLFREKRRQGIAVLEPLDVQDIANKIAQIVVVGGVRRSSEISISDLNDLKIAEAKMGAFWDNGFAHRAMSNNSAAYDYKPDAITFAENFLTLMKSGTGERGIFNREGAYKQMAASGRRKIIKNGVEYYIIGTNPCGEIILRDMEFCNLSEVVVRPDDTLDTLRQKVKIASMFGAWQATFTHFPFLRPEWKQNCEEERLLGVSLTGARDHEVLNHVNDTAKRWLSDLKGVAINSVEKWCGKLDINMSAAITCNKPSGTVGQLVNCSSGVGTREAVHQIRRYRNSANDPVFHLYRDAGVPWFPEVGEADPNNPMTVVMEFPLAAPDKSVTKNDVTALEQLSYWKMFKEFWCEHNPSVTINVDTHEWLDVMAWCHKNFDDLCGLSFLPKDNGVYQLAPNEAISKEEYEKRLAAFPKIDHSKLSQYELDDSTTGSQSYACTGNQCEIA